MKNTVCPRLDGAGAIADDDVVWTTRSATTARVERAVIGTLALDNALSAIGTSGLVTVVGPSAVDSTRTAKAAADIACAADAHAAERAIARPYAARKSAVA